MTHQLIPGSLITLEGLRALRLAEQVDLWRHRGKMKAHLAGRTLYFETDPIIEEVKKCKAPQRRNTTQQGAKG